MGLIKTPEDYFSVVETGQLDTMMEGETAEVLQVQSENEELQEGTDIPVIVTDNHLMHIKEHKAVLASPEARRNPEILQATLNHINQHIEFLQDPNLAVLNGLLGQPPVPPQGMPPQMPQAPQQGTGQAAETLNPQNPIQQEAMGDVNMPNMPSMPTNPLTGQQYNTGDGGDPRNTI